MSDPTAPAFGPDDQPPNAESPLASTHNAPAHNAPRHGDHDHDGQGHDPHDRNDSDPGHGGHAGHSHGVSANADRRYLVAGLALMTAFMLGEVVVAFISGSLALLSDAGHMLSDVAAIAVAIWAMSLAARPATLRWTFGLKRAEILAAAVNGITMLVVAGILLVEAVRRIFDPPEVQGGLVLIVALVGCVVNVIAAWLIAKANRQSLNVEGAYQHIVTDLYGFIGTAIAGAVILLTGWTVADVIATLIVVALMLHASWGLLRDSGHILLEGTPKHVDLEAVRKHLLEVDHVEKVHDLHAWTLTSNAPALSAHLIIADGCFHDGHAPRLLDQVQACLAEHFDVEHSTFQMEPDSHAGHEVGAH